MRAAPDSPRLEDNCHGFYRARSGIAAFRLRCSRKAEKDLTSLAIMPGVFALIACVTYSARIG
jgi:hypothetical protein